MTIRFCNFVTGALAAFVMLASGAVYPAGRGLSPEQQPIAEIGEEAAAPAAGIKVAAWVDRPNATYRPGDALTVMVKASKDAYITVLDAGTSGKVHVVYPNKYQRDNRVQAHEVVQIPGEESRFRLTVHGPPGLEVLKILATEDPIAHLDVRRLSEAGAFYTVPGDAQSIARDRLWRCHAGRNYRERKWGSRFDPGERLTSAEEAVHGVPPSVLDGRLLKRRNISKLMLKLVRSEAPRCLCRLYFRAAMSSCGSAPASPDL
jgi:hypothetical protein